MCRNGCNDSGARDRPRRRMSHMSQPVVHGSKCGFVVDGSARRKVREYQTQRGGQWYAARDEVEQGNK